jgi:hypothetical protein
MEYRSLQFIAIRKEGGQKGYSVILSKNNKCLAQHQLLSMTTFCFGVYVVN